ncbi:alpha/beta hydrolase [Terrarubrum flagellatum]|uniref:alpha/beta fold hydrolase n=1 Tax=Terrirubrum flagellatum TaxID=2895980 RepID=UPI0031454FAA
MPKIKINGAMLNVEVLGQKPSAPVMIVHHGAPGLGSHVEPKTSFGPLSDEYRVVVFDARGSGASEDAPPFSHEQWVADVDAIREWIGAEKIVMAGGSYGGFIAMEYTIRHPDRVRALVLRDTSPDRDHDPAARANALASPRIKVDLDLFNRIMDGEMRDDADLKAAWRHILPLYDHDLDMKKVEERAERTPYHFVTHNYAFSVNLKNYDLKDRLPGIKCPTLVTVGRHDWITPVFQSEKIANLIPNAELVIFEKSGHSPQIEEADKFQATVRAFLKRALA